MTARLHRIHGMLRAGNVPSALGSRPDGGTVLLAGAPEHGFWDVQVRDTSGRLWLIHPSGTDELPGDSTDTWVADAIKHRPGLG